MKNHPEQALSEQSKPNHDDNCTGNPTYPQYSIDFEFITKTAQCPRDEEPVAGRASADCQHHRNIYTQLS